MTFKLDWGSVIVAIVKKKDLDSYDFANCWSEDYDWTELDLFVINSFRELVIDYIEVDIETQKLKGWTRNKMNLDLNEYLKELEE